MQIKWPKLSLNSKKLQEAAVIESLSQLAAALEGKVIPVVMDDWDAGYSLAIDEVLTLVNDAINLIVSENDVNYSGDY